MSNVVYEDKYYNTEIKQRFIDEYAAGTQKILSRIFKISYSVESDLQKDLYDFNREELRKLFFLFMAKTTYSSKANVTWVSKYIDWARDEQLARGINPLETVSTEWKEQFVNKSIKKYWTEKEIDKIISSLVNAQDAIIVRLPFEGVRGTSNAEIVNLRKKDLDTSNNTLTLTDQDGSQRVITVSEKCIDLCLKALREDDYEKMNGNPSPDIKATTANLVQNDYVVKSVNTRTEHLESADFNVVHRRLAKIANEINEPNFTTLNLTYSGILFKAYELVKLTGKLEDEEYKMICDQFGINADQSLYRLKNEFLNMDYLKQLYSDI